MTIYPRIAIIGGGLSALTLGRVLQLKNIPFTIFEREPSAHHRTQGGTLDPDKSSGQLALHIAQLYDKFREHMRLEGQAVKVANEHAEWLFQNTPSEGDESRPEIDRSHLRQIFLDVIGDPIA